METPTYALKMPPAFEKGLKRGAFPHEKTLWSS